MFGWEAYCEDDIEAKRGSRSVCCDWGLEKGSPACLESMAGKWRTEAVNVVLALQKDVCSKSRLMNSSLFGAGRSGTLVEG